MSFVQRFTYDRGQLSTGTSSGPFVYAPIYGASISFSSKNTDWNAGNYNNFIMPQGINNLSAQIDMSFQGSRARMTPLINRLQFLTTGEYIGSAALRETEYIPSFSGSLNGVQIFTGVNGDQDISNTHKTGNGVFIPENGVLEVNWSGSSFDAGFRDIVFPFIVKADQKTRYDIEFGFRFATAGINRYYFLVDGNVLKAPANNDVFIQSGLQDSGPYKYNNVFNTTGETKTGFLTLRAYSSTSVATGAFGNNQIRSIKFSGMSMKESHATSLLNFGSNDNFVTINLDKDYYNDFSGSQISSFEVLTLSNDVYQVNVQAFNNSNSPLLQKGMAFVNKTGVFNWNQGPRQRFDVVSGQSNSNVFDNYFYVTGSNYNQSDSNFLRNISGLSGYTGYVNAATRVFFWEPDQSVNMKFDHGNRILELKNSFMDQLNFGRNQNAINNLMLTFSHRSRKETYSILHFLESHLGYLPFVYYFGDGIINQNRVFYCPEWSHTFDYKDSNTIEANFIEIVNPTIPKF